MILKYGVIFANDHYIKTLISSLYGFLKVFKSDRCSDVSLN
jgi:hypothetical protein